MVYVMMIAVLGNLQFRACTGFVAYSHPPVTKRCSTLSGHISVVEGKDFKKYSIVTHDDEYSFCVRHSGKLNEGNGGR